MDGQQLLSLGALPPGPIEPPFWLHALETVLLYAALTAMALVVLGLLKALADSFRPDKTMRRIDLYVAACASVAAVLLTAALVTVMAQFGSTLDGNAWAAAVETPCEPAAVLCTLPHVNDDITPGNDGLPGGEVPVDVVDGLLFYGMTLTALVTVSAIVLGAIRRVRRQHRSADNARPPFPRVERNLAITSAVVTVLFVAAYFFVGWFFGSTPLIME